MEHGWWTWARTITGIIVVVKGMLSTKADVTAET